MTFLRLFLLCFGALFPFWVLPDSKNDDSMEYHLEEFLRKMGYDVNVTSSGIYMDQKAGYATAGGMSLRNSVVDQNPVNIRMPTINGGCGGIDIYNGAFSFISAKELINTLKNIGSNAATYAFMLALETTSPQIANNLRSLQGWANYINGIGINSCEIGTQIVGSVWPRSQRASEKLCNDLETSSGKVSDYIRARHDCSDSKSITEAHSKMKQTSSSYIGGDCNIAWKVINENSFLKKNREIAELMMNLTGTIIIRTIDDAKDDKKNQTTITTIPSKALNEGFFKVLLEGGKANIIVCDETEKCLNPVDKSDKEFPKEESWLGQVQQIVKSIQQHIIEDIELNEQQQLLLGSTDLPVLRLLAADIAYHHGRTSDDVHQWIDMIATDFLLKFINDLIESTHQTAIALKVENTDVSLLEKYIEELERIETKIRHLEIKSKERQDREMQILQKLDWLEEKIRSNW